jgi:hypothetical protein
MHQTGQPKQHIPVFVGSTYEDLTEYRNAVRDALHRLETIVRGMEYFGSKPGSPKDECIKAVASCRLYIGIFAMRYGSVDEETGKSMTHLEFEEACRLKLPSLIYLLDEEKQPVLAKFVDTGDKAERLSALKAELKKRFVVSFFTSPEDLAKRVTQDLPPLLKDIGVSVAQAPPEKISDDAKTLIRQFRARPAKHAGKELLVDGEVLDDFSGVDASDCAALRLPLGDAIERRVKSPVLDDFARVVATGEMADWLESTPAGTKVRMKIRLLFGKTEDIQYGPEGPIESVRLIRAYRLIALVDGDTTPKTKHDA